MKIGLIDVDSKWCNLALMKISSFHKSIGDDVEWINYFSNYDIVYISKIFKFTKDISTQINSAKIIKGGTGYDINVKLPSEIEICDPDYSIYPEKKYSIQLFSRGCIRSCEFCLVSKKEGGIKPIAPMKLNPNGTYIEVLDNNFFANKNWQLAIEYLFKTNLPVNFNGVDVRIITEEQCIALNKLKHYKQIHIAWDNPNEDLIPKIKLLTSIVKAYKIMCYVLIGYNSTPEQDNYRVMKLVELGIVPFVMPFNKKDNYQKKYSRFVNKLWVFKSCNCDFNNYLKKGYKNITIENQTKFNY